MQAIMYHISADITPLLWDKDNIPHLEAINHKVPWFTVPKFVGNSLEGQAFVDNIVRKVKDHGQLSYLKD